MEFLNIESINWTTVFAGITTLATVASCALDYWKYFFPSRTHVVVHRPLNEVVVKNNAEPKVPNETEETTDHNG
uniref:Uncharacterized protein n=1 Tax=Acrobeloides nanus TaxID=290746 RepID=A0A914D9H2_9BILA